MTILEIFFVPTKPYSGSKKFPVIIYLWCDPLFKRDYKKFYIFYYYKRKVMCIRSIKLPNRSSSCLQSTILVSDRSLFILHVICIFFLARIRSIHDKISFLSSVQWGSEGWMWILNSDCMKNVV